jgi:nucleotide-binding universal stress UspA family protein
MVPMTGSIICGVDDSESADGALRVAHALAVTLGRRLVLVRVVEPGSRLEEIDAVAERFQRLTESAALADTEALWLVDNGHPVDRLVAAAVDEAASLIVLGSHGARSPLLGSISAEVSRRAPCPVVVVPPGAESVVVNGKGGVGFVSPGRAWPRDPDVAGGVAVEHIPASAMPDFDGYRGRPR